MRFFINIIDLTQNGQHEFHLRARWSFCIQSKQPSLSRISQRITGWKLAIWQRRWNGIYSVRMTFRSPVAAAHYAFDFIRTQWTPWTKVREALAQGVTYDR